MDVDLERSCNYALVSPNPRILVDKFIQLRKLNDKSNITHRLAYFVHDDTYVNM